jgi:replicative DNA helicase
MTELLPHDLPLEESILGAILMQPDGTELLSKVETSHFYSDSVAVCIKSLKDMALLGQPCQPDVLLAVLRANGKLPRVGGARYLFESIGTTPAIATSKMGFYIDRLRDLASRRDIIRHCKQAIAEAHTDTEDSAKASTITDGLCGTLMAANVGGTSDSFHEIHDSVKRFFLSLQSKIEARERGVLAVPSCGILRLDSALGGGLLPGRLVILAARPSMGKTALALSMASSACKTKSEPLYGVHFISIETDDDRITSRALGLESKLNTSKIILGDLDAGGWKELTSAAQAVSKLRLTIDDSPAMSLAQLRTSIHRAQVKHQEFDANGNLTARLGVVFVDYLQLIDAGLNSQASQEQALTAISQALQRMAKEFRVCIVALSQLSRAVEARTNKRPCMSDLRGSGGIEQAADVILGVYRDDYYNHGSKDTGITELLVLKSKEGPTGVVRVSYRKECMAFADLEET